MSTTKKPNAISSRPARRGALAAALISAAWAPQALAELDCADTTPIYEIQGRSHVSPFLGQEVETCGVVTAVDFNGYYIQDAAGDGDDATADGIFVFQFGNLPEVGTRLRLRDTVTEFIPGGADTGNLSITQLSFPEVLGEQAGAPLPAPVIIGRAGRVPPNETVISADEIDPPINLQDPADAALAPFDPAEDGIDFYESLEGMLVTVEDPVAVSAIRQFGTFSAEVFVLANDGADVAPADARTERGGINLQPDPDNRGDQNPERVQIQFNPTLSGNFDFPKINVGDRLEDVTGVVGYSFGNFEVNTLAPVAVVPGDIAQETVIPRGRGPLRIASYNVLNLSAVSGDDAQRAEVARHIARNLRAPDIVALQEIQDNNGDIADCEDNDLPVEQCSFVLDASRTLDRLVQAIEQAGGPRYEYIDVPPLQETTQTAADGPDVFGGVPLGNIRNAFLYNPRRVRLEGFTGLNRGELLERGVSVPNAFDFSRDPLEAVFRFRGETVTVLNCHFSSRFGSTPIFGGPQPFVQAGEAAREAQSLAINEVAAGLLEQDEDANVVVAGDLNTFEFTNDLTEILPGAGDARILRNLVPKNRDDNVYTFIFEGNSQVLDHIFVSERLFDRARLDIVHVNVDFARRFGDVVGSDHEPLLATLKLQRGRAGGNEGRGRGQDGDRPGRGRGRH